MHRDEPARVAAVGDVTQDRVTQAAGPPARADDGHSVRLQEPLHRARLRALLAGRHHGATGGGRLDVEGHGEDVLLATLRHVVPRLAERRDHPPVVGEHLGHEALHAALEGGCRQVLQQH